MLTNTTPLVTALRTSLIAVSLAVTLSACGSTKWGFPYRADVQQGNWITSEQVAQLEPGMSRAQVRFILGTPALQDALHANRWDYTYYNKPGYGDKEIRHLTVWFDGDLLVKWEGDEQPNRQPFERTDTGASEVEAEETSPTVAEPEAMPQPEAETSAIQDAATPIQPQPLP